MTGHTMAMIDGHRWFYWRTRHCDEYAGMPELLMMRWFLKDDTDWVGDFGTKREMLDWIKEDGPDFIAEYRENK